MNWLQSTLRTYPEMAIFLSLGLGFWFGGKTFRGFSLGAVTSTLIASLIIGQAGIVISPNVKSTFFLMFLFAIGYGVGPQFVRGIAKDGLPQALFAVVMCVLCLAAPLLATWIAGYGLGSTAGMFAGSQTISASMGLATDAINRLGMNAEQTRQQLDAMPVAYAVTYIFGTVGSALILALLGPKLLRIDLVKACKDYEISMGGHQDIASEGTAWHRYVLRAYKVPEHSEFVGLTISQAESRSQGKRVFIERLRRDGKIESLTTSTTLMAGDILAVAGQNADILALLSHSEAEVDDPELLAVPAEGVDIFVTNKRYDGQTLEQLSRMPVAHGVFIRKIKRGAISTELPVLPKTVIHRGDIITLAGLTSDTTAAAKELGQPDRTSNVADVAFIGMAIFIGALIGAAVFTVHGVPITLSTAGGALIAGLVFGWLRSIHPTFGRIPEPTVWFMNSVGLNVFIAVVGINAASGFVHGLQTIGVSLFLWGIFATSLPLIIGMFIARYVFRFHPALVLGCCAGARTTTAALGMLCETAKSNVPALGYTVTYAVGNTLLTIWGMVLIVILS